MDAALTERAELHVNPVTATQRSAMAETTAATFELDGVRRRFPLVEDVRGNAKPNLAAPADVAVTLALWQTAGEETTVGRDRQVSDWIARFPVGTDVTGRDLIIVDGVTYEVVGPPVDAKTHVRARLRHVSG